MMNDEQKVSTLTPYSLLSGTVFFIIGLIIDDMYTVITGSSLLIIATISATGEKIIKSMDYPPKSL